MAVYILSCGMPWTKIGYSREPKKRLQSINADGESRLARHNSPCCSRKDWRIAYVWVEGTEADEQRVLQLLDGIGFKRYLSEHPKKALGQENGESEVFLASVDEIFGHLMFSSEVGELKPLEIIELEQREARKRRYARLTRIAEARENADRPSKAPFPDLS